VSRMSSVAGLVVFGKCDVFVKVSDRDFDADFGHAKDVAAGQDRRALGFVRFGAFHDGDADAG
jgi:hypothetical protein